MRQLPTLLLTSLTVMALAGAAEAQKKGGIPGAGKTAGVCGAKVLPLVVGNVWKYGQVQAPVTLPENMARLMPLPVKELTITVKEIETKDKMTVAKLEEKFSVDISRDPKVSKLVERTINSTITCNGKKFDISPESFFFNGEPGGFFGLTFDKFERKKETSWKLTNGGIGEAEWIEEIGGTWKRTPQKGAESAKLGAGRIEIERRFTPQPTERLATKMGDYMRAEKLGITTTGRVLLDNKLSPEGKPCNTRKMDPIKKEEVLVWQEACDLPANWITQVWLVETVGVVQVLNSYAHMYQLIQADLK